MALVVCLQFIREFQKRSEGESPSCHENTFEIYVHIVNNCAPKNRVELDIYMKTIHWEDIDAYIHRQKY